jgi:hypothetical protein
MAREFFPQFEQTSRPQQAADVLGTIGRSAWQIVILV